MTNTAVSQWEVAGARKISSQRTNELNAKTAQQKIGLAKKPSLPSKIPVIETLSKCIFNSIKRKYNLGIYKLIFILFRTLKTREWYLRLLGTRVGRRRRSKTSQGEKVPKVGKKYGKERASVAEADKERIRVGESSQSKH